MLEQAGIWPHLDPKAVWPLRQARVRDRGLPFRLDVDNSGDASGAPLGWLVSNWRIRKAAFDAASSLPGWQLLDAPMLCGLARHAQGWQLQMADGRHLQAATVIAADSRFSPTRRLLGVGARSRDHGMAMLACNVQLERDHGGQAWQWFGDGCTHALLPLQPGVASAVLTLPTAQAQALLAAGAGTYGARVSTPFEHRWGNMQACSSAHLYPMVTVYADRFAGPGFALAGDAAVGMDPLTAHGFNLGIRSAAELAKALLRCGPGRARDIALAGYAGSHRQATAPLYAATALVAGMYSDMRMPARIIRGGALALAAALPPFPALLRRHLTATA